MKKITSFILFALLSAVAYSQDILHLRANQLIAGYRDNIESPVVWNDPQDVNILIKLEESKATVYSKVTQVYHVVSVIGKTPTCTTYRCTNIDGRLCNLLLFSIPEAPGFIYFSVEFSDMVWFYKTKIE